MNRAGSPPAWYARIPDLLLIAAGILTGILAARTFWYLFQSVSNTPYTDSWLLLDEVRQFREGASGWTYLWQPYWGQRPIVARLLFLISVRYFSFTGLPLILVNLMAQFALLAVLIGSVWAVFRKSPRLFFACAIAFTNLLLSSLGMELLVITQNVQHSIGYASSICAIVLFARRPWLGILLAILATAALAIGLVVWPILLLQASLQAWRAPARSRVMTISILCVLTLAVGVLYFAGYTRPPSFGMGVTGALLHPSMTALVLGGPITLYSLRLGTVAGALGMATLGYFILFGNRTAFPLTMAASFLAILGRRPHLARVDCEPARSAAATQPLHRPNARVLGLPLRVSHGPSTGDSPDRHRRHRPDPCLGDVALAVAGLPRVGCRLPEIRCHRLRLFGRRLRPRTHVTALD